MAACAGSTAMITAIAAPAVMGVIGIATDYANFSAKSSALQALADSAAIAAAREMALSSSTDDTIVQSGEAFVAASARGKVSAGVSVKRSAGSVQVTVTETWTPFFAHYLGAKITPIVSTATASLAGQANICVLALDGDAGAALQLKTGGRVKANGCGVLSNSTDAQGIRLKNASAITATLTCSSGGIDASGGTISPAGITDCPPTDDPLASRTPPAAGACTYNNVKLTGGTAALDPGTYCGGIDITGTANVTFNPGTYVIKSGAFKLSGSASITGADVGFYLQGDEAYLNFVGNTSVKLSGAETGPMAGLLFFGDPAADDTIKHRINSKNTSELTGTIYLPRGELTIDPAGGQVAEDSAYTAIVAKTIQIAGGPELVLNSDYGATKVPVPAGIKANAEVVLSQ
jgi:hypothetical protein